MVDANTHYSDYSDFVEVDPTGRYGRYNEILGKGASKTVYRAFDEYEGIEVAWNQVKLLDFLQSPQDLERLYCEIHLLKTLKHKNIMKFYTSWVDTSNRNINFITEMFTSGTLRQYRQKHRRVNLRAVKHWCRQILQGLAYLHSHEPPIIHRDLKCDNIFINGNQGEVKIGDLGLAAILRKSHAANCVGTPEFMAPEVYKEEYNELVDIYSFGMCILEMVTFEYPYSECTHAAQIYKKVITGNKPEALYRVNDPEVRQFIEKCLATASQRLSAMELLMDPFFLEDQCPDSYEECSSEIDSSGMQPSFDQHHRQCKLAINELFYDFQQEAEFENGWDYNQADVQTHGIELFNGYDDEHPPNVDITIKGRKREDGSIFLRLRIADKEARMRNIYFPFDIETDTALCVATEMVAELDIMDHDVTRIAEMIDGEVSSLVPDWKAGPVMEEMLGNRCTTFCYNCNSNVSSCGSFLDYLSQNAPGCNSLHPIHCSRIDCASMHGRFEEVTYEVEGSEHCVTEGAPALSTSHSDGLDLASQASGESHSDKDCQILDQTAKDQKLAHMEVFTGTAAEESEGILHTNLDQQQHLGKPDSAHHCPKPNLCDEYEDEVHQQLRWLNTKYQMELRQYKSRKLGVSRRVLHSSADFDHWEETAAAGVSSCPIQKSLGTLHNAPLKSFHLSKNISFQVPHCEDANRITPSKSPHNTNGKYYQSNRLDLVFERIQHCTEISECSEKSLYSGVGPMSLARSKSLPVDAVDF